MQGHMKKPPTEAVTMTFIGPVAMMDKALEVMHRLGFQEEQLSTNQQADGSIPWRESEHFKNADLPAAYLSGARYREGLTQEDLSERTGIPRRHLSEMENSKRPIGKQNARKLAEALNIDPRRLLAV